MSHRFFTPHHWLAVASMFGACLLGASVAASLLETSVSAGTPNKTTISPSARPRNRADSLVALTSRLGVGAGSTVADIGAGKGRDTWVFARLVGESGSVWAEEITPGMVDALRKESETRGLRQVRPILGRTDDPCLPAASVDLAYVNHVYHHLAQPRDMLRGIWRGLKPGGYLVVIDQRRGTLRDWVPRQLRAKQHHWIAETTVVREAREEGFAFVGGAEEHWHAEGDFVLVFQRPGESAEPGRDPDAFLPLALRTCVRNLVPAGSTYERPVFIALGEGRRLIPPLVRRSRHPGLDVVLEEWATQKEERPPLPAGLTLPSTLTQNGDPNLGPEPIDVVFFLDSYHLPFHGKTLLSKLHERLSPTGRVYVLDRHSDEPLSRRQASHHRKIQPQTVEREMAEAGFHLWSRGPQCAPDRFLLVFGKTPAADKEDP